MHKISLLRPFLIYIAVSCAGIPVYSQQSLPSAYNGDIKINYVRTWEAVKPDSNKNNLTVSSPLAAATMTTQYLDGLGRPIQIVVKKGSLVTDSTARDLVSPIVYDEYGRQPYKYLPFAANNYGGNTHISDGLFKLNPFQQDSVFNKSIFPDENYFYSKTDFEACPLNRVNKTMAAGDSWTGAARGVETKYWFNRTADSVRAWSVTDVNNAFGNYESDSSYPANTLYKNVTIDERGKQIIEFKDKQGQLILKKVQLTAQPDTGTGKNHTGWLCTYYIYDDWNNLRCVIQPEGVKQLAISNWLLTATLLNEQCFRYEYDKRNRVTMKKAPGAGSVWMVYDARDRLVLSQDSVMRGNHQWLYTQYDALNRPIATGIFTDNSNYNNLSYHALRADTSSNYPAAGAYTVDTLAKTFYDDYDWRNGQGNPLSATRNIAYDSYLQAASNTLWPYPQDATLQSNLTRGLVTGTKTKVVDTPIYLYAANFYDDKGRVIQVQSTNITNGTDIATTQYSWSGQPLFTVQKLEKAGTNAQTIIALTQITYDSLWRISQIDKKISHSQVNNDSMPAAWTTILQNEYDALGQLKKKKLAPQYNDDAGLETLVYDYNIRGWMLGMNRGYAKDTANTDHFFGFDLGYDKRNFLVNGSAKSYADSMFNGNIAGMLWKSAGDSRVRKYDFAYDAANRILSADFNQLTNNSFSKEAGIDFSMYGMSYDANGNILTMNQRGLKGLASQTIDSLLYGYNSNSNRLNYVTDRVNDADTKLGDFKEAVNNTSQDYTYDANGNMFIDNNKGISYIHYNYLNLPDSIVVTGKGNIRYLYDATGTKQKKITTEGAKITTILYLGGAVFKNDTLEFIAQEEGRVRKKDTTELVYDYFIKDHLGNVRMVLTTERDTSFYPPASMETVEDPNNTNDPSNYIPYYSRTDYTENSDWRFPIEEIPDYPNDNFTEPNEYVAKLDGDQQKIGPGIVLKVMAGDKFSFRVTSLYTHEDGGGFDDPGDPFNDLLAALSNGINITIPSRGHPDEIADFLASDPGFNAGITQFLNHQLAAGQSPQAFVNWILLDEQFRYVEASSGYEHVGSANSLEEHTRNGLPVTQNGYLYIYVSNSTPNINVFFDNLQVTHIRGPILEETHYYPFGLTMAGISSKALLAGDPQNRYKFNDGNELQSREFYDGSGLEMFDAVARMYDPQLGRFWQVDELAESNWEWSPYTFALDNPIEFNDPLGLDPEISTPENPVELPEVVVWSYTPRQMVQIWWDLKQAGIPIDNIKNNYLREEVQRHDRIQNFLNEVHRGIREDQIFLLELGSWFIPTGWITKIRYLKYLKFATKLFQLKRGLTAFKALEYAAEYGIKTYRQLIKLSPVGTEVHHLIEKRFAALFGQSEKEMLSIVVTKDEHRLFTKAWQEKIGLDGWKTTQYTTSTVPSREYVEDVARDIYKDYPEILKALGL